MNFFGDYHIHTNLSDGHTSLKCVFDTAAKLGLKEIGISDHGYASAVFGMTEKKFLKQEKEIKSFGDEIKIYHGIETNILNENGDIDVPNNAIKNYDFLTLGFHRYLKISKTLKAKDFILGNGFCGIKKREELKDLNTKAFVAAINKYPIDIIAHLNYRAMVDVKVVLQAMKENNVYLELNESHVYALNGYGKEIIDSGVNMIVCSDAHRKANIGKTSNIEQFIAANNLPVERIYGLTNSPHFKDKK